MYQLFTSNLVTRSASADHAADADRSVGDAEYTRVGTTADREVFDPSESTFILVQFSVCMIVSCYEWCDIYIVNVTPFTCDTFYSKF